jgi:hypothetical protein
MNPRSRASVTALAVVMCFVLLATLPAAGQTSSSAAPASAAKKSNLPRTLDGHPDLNGVYSNATSVPLERPKNLGAKEFYTP